MRESPDITQVLGVQVRLESQPEREKAPKILVCDQPGRQVCIRETVFMNISSVMKLMQS